MDDAIIQVIGDQNSTISVENSRIDVKAFIVNNRPTSIRIVDS